MKGEISGDDEQGRTGAIPPIGTRNEPFTGYFDGCGSTISNLWVSTRHDDWREHPDEHEDYVSTHVGLFGAIGNEAIVEDFILDTVEITTNIIESKVGIVCGFVNAMVKNVGVYNGIISVVDEGSCTSNYSLIGEKDPRIIWDDMPPIDSEYGDSEEDDGEDDGGGGDDGDDGGGDLLIDPNNFSGKSEVFTPLSDGEYDPVFGAIDALFAPSPSSS